MSEAVVLDAGVALRWFVADPTRRRALTLLDVRETLAAPESLPADVAALACARAETGAITPHHAEAIAAAVPHYVPRLVPSTGLVGRALDMTLAFHVPFASALYLACAERLDGILVTADRGLFHAVAGTPPAQWVIRLSDIELGAPMGADAEELPFRISVDAVEEVIRRADRLRGSAADPGLHSLNYRGLKSLLQAMERDELADILALAWLGQGRADAAWPPLRTRAEAFLGSGQPPVPFVCRLAPHVRRGLERLQQA